jgi:hypothetical protein
MENYFTVVIPYTSSGATVWHPTDMVGPFSTLTRGAFATLDEARMWADSHLGGTAYTIRYVDHEAEIARENYERKVALMHELIRLTGLAVSVGGGK